jgi:hypothetical protein
LVSAKHAAIIFGGVALLSSGWGRQREVATVAQTTVAYSEMTMHPRADVARAESSVQSNHIVEYSSAEYGFRFAFDSSRISIRHLGPSDLELYRGDSLFANLIMVDPFDLYRLVRDTSWGLKALRGTSMFPDTNLAIALHVVANTCAADGALGSDYLEMPPTKVRSDTTAHGLRVLKFWFDYGYHVIRERPKRVPVGPIYIVDISAAGKPHFLGVVHSCEELTSPAVEALLDNLVTTIQVRR